MRCQSPSCTLIGHARDAPHVSSDMAAIETDTHEDVGAEAVDAAVAKVGVTIDVPYVEKYRPQVVRETPVERKAGSERPKHAALAAF